MEYIRQHIKSKTRQLLFALPNCRGSVCHKYYRHTHMHSCGRSAVWYFAASQDSICGPMHCLRLVTTSHLLRVHGLPVVAGQRRAGSTVATSSLRASSRNCPSGRHTQPTPNAAIVTNQQTTLVWLNLRSSFGWMHDSHLPEDEQLVWLACGSHVHTYGINIWDPCGRTCALHVAGCVHLTWPACGPHAVDMWCMQVLSRVGSAVPARVYYHWQGWSLLATAHLQSGGHGSGR